METTSEVKSIQKPTLSEYNQSPIIVIDRFLSFGLGKARKIVANIAYIQKFVETEGKSLE